MSVFFSRHQQHAQERLRLWRDVCDALATALRVLASVAADALKWRLADA